MIILTIRTDKPEAEVGLYDDDRRINHKVWHAHRELGRTIHSTVKGLLDEAGKNWQDIEGIVGFRGPGSFTGLRIGLTVADALALSNSCPIVGTMNDEDEDWKEKGIQRLLAGENDQVVLPEYGAEAHITQPRK